MAVIARQVLKTYLSEKEYDNFEKLLLTRYQL